MDENSLRNLKRAAKERAAHAFEDILMETGKTEKYKKKQGGSVLWRCPKKKIKYDRLYQVM